jgi:UrcA family protein
MFRLALASGAAALCIASSPFALAQEESMTVRVSDLNLDSAAGARMALARAGLAADRFCGGEADIRQMQRAGLAEACRTTMVGRAVRAMNAPRVTALYGRPNGVTFARR